jgi:hypothetical protein|nr:MAG TPA: glycoprotein repeat protein [Caudoviricetes sp.]
MAIREIKIKTNGDFWEYPSVPLVCGDTQAYKLVIPTAQYGGADIIKVTALREDGVTVIGSAPIPGAEAEYTLQNNMYAMEGQVKIRVSLIKDESILTTAELVFDVLSAADETGIDADDRYPVLSQMLVTATHVVEQGNYAQAQGEYARTQGDYAGEQGDYAKAQGEYVAEFTTQFQEHKSASELDHPENSVKTKHIANGAVNAQKLEQTLKLTIDSKAEGIEHYQGNLDDCRTIGLYYVTGSNLPPNETQGYMTVYHSIDDTMQLIYCFDNSEDNVFRGYIRTGYIPDNPQEGRQWTDWRAIDTHAKRVDNPHRVTKVQLGLSNVDNTADMDKPISTATQVALDSKAELNHMHTMSNVSDSPNIHKNWDDTTGDIISTHLTVGYRSGDFGKNSIAIGEGNVASGEHSFAMGYYSKATGKYAVASGEQSTASGFSAYAEGYNTNATGNYSRAEGQMTNANGAMANAEGYNTNANGKCSHAEGESTTAVSRLEHVQGQYNKISTTSATAYISTANAMVIGNGTSDTTRSNAFRVTFNGNVYGLATFHSTGADYAEYFEWEDGNPDGEDRVGRFVAIDGEKIHVAGKNDTNILGIVSANPAVLGNAHEDTYHGMYLTDEWGRVQYEYVDVSAEYEERVVGVDEEGNNITERMEVHPARRDYVPKLNPSYNPDEEYVPRSERNEWDAVGMMGQLLVHDDGTCVLGGFCTCTDGGAATASETGYYVMSRVSDGIIKILFK